MRNYIEELQEKSITQSKIDELKDKYENSDSSSSESSDEDAEA